MLYEDVIPPDRPLVTTDLARYTAANTRRERCEETVRIQQAVAANQQARFELEVRSEGVQPVIVEAMTEAARDVGLKERLRAHTDKPAFIWLEPGFIGMDLQFHPERYHRAARPSEVLAIDYSAFEAPMNELLELKQRTGDRLQDQMKLAFGNFRARFRLMRPDGRRVTIDVVELYDRVAYPDTLRLLSVRGGERVLRSAVADVAGTRRWVLGPRTTQQGLPTPSAEIADFFELKP